MFGIATIIGGVASAATAETIFAIVKTTLPRHASKMLMTSSVIGCAAIGTAVGDTIEDSLMRKAAKAKVKFDAAKEEAKRRQTEKENRKKERA